MADKDAMERLLDTEIDQKHGELAKCMQNAVLDVDLRIVELGGLYVRRLETIPKRKGRDAYIREKAEKHKVDRSTIRRWMDKAKIGGAGKPQMRFTQGVQTKLLGVVASAYANAPSDEASKRQKQKNAGEGHAPHTPKEGKNGEAISGLSDDVVAALKSGKVKMSQEQATAWSEFEEESQDALLDAVVKKRITIDDAIETGEVPPETATEVMKKTRKAYNAVVADLRTAIKRFETDKTLREDHWAHYHGAYDDVEKALATLVKYVNRNRPEALCPLCEGDGCERCGWSGFMPRHILKQLSENSKL